jgi:hypothetical protein
MHPARLQEPAHLCLLPCEAHHRHAARAASGRAVMFADGRRLNCRLLVTTRSPGVLTYCWPIEAILSEYRFGQDVNACVCFGSHARRATNKPRSDT